MCGRQDTANYENRWQTMDYNIIDEGTVRIIDFEKPSWQWCLDGNWSLVFSSYSAPNAFNRLMQKLILGIHWRRINDR